MLISPYRSLLLAATLAAVAVVPIWQAAADIARQTDDLSPSSMNINVDDDETLHSDVYDDTSVSGIRGLRKKKKKNSMSNSKSQKATKRPKAKGKKKKKNIFVGDEEATCSDSQVDICKGGKEGNPCTTVTCVVDDSSIRYHCQTVKETEVCFTDNGAVCCPDDKPICKGGKCMTEEEAVPHCGVCAECDESVWNRNVCKYNPVSGKEECYTCGERIVFEQSPEGGSKSLFDACTFVSNENILECLPCNPNICDQGPYPGEGKKSKATIGVSVYEPQVGIDTTLAGMDIFEQHVGNDYHRFSHIGVYYIPEDISEDEETQKYLVGMQDDMPSDYISSGYHSSSSCIDTIDNPYPSFQDAYTPDKFINLEGKGFEITFSNGPSNIFFSEYAQTLALGSPGSYIEGSGSSKSIWTPYASVTIWVQTDLNAADFMLAGEDLARQMNLEGGYSPNRCCQDFSMRLLSQLQVPEGMIREAEKYHLTDYDKDFLDTSCHDTPLPIEMCGNMGFLGIPHVNIPLECEPYTSPVSRELDTRYGKWGKRKNPATCWDDGVPCLDGVTCGNCCNGYHYDLEDYLPACGAKGSGCRESGDSCYAYYDCGQCCNGSYGFIYRFCL